MVLVKKRDSNIELFRIIMMLSIVAHHYVVNSGLMDVIASDPFGPKPILMLIFGAWGKVGINGFVLITGYYMCKSNITVKKYLKLLLEVLFYKYLIYFIFLLTGRVEFGWGRLVKALLPITGVTDSFTNCYLLFYLLIPFCSLLVQSMNQKQHLVLNLILFCVYSVLGTIPVFFTIRFNYISWFVVLFFFGAYIRNYDPQIIKKHVGLKLTILLFLDIVSIIVLVKLNYGKYYFLNDANKLLALLTAIYLFSFFKQLKLGYHKWINVISASTFGVLLIHANSDTMRSWLWGDVLRNTYAYQQSWWFAHAVFCVLGVYIICTCIDWLRIQILERPLLSWYERHETSFVSFIRTKLNRLFYIIK